MCLPELPKMSFIPKPRTEARVADRKGSLLTIKVRLKNAVTAVCQYARHVCDLHHFASDEESIKAVKDGLKIQILHC